MTVTVHTARPPPLESNYPATIYCHSLVDQLPLPPPSLLNVEVRWMRVAMQLFLKRAAAEPSGCQKPGGKQVAGALKRVQESDRQQVHYRRLACNLFTVPQCLLLMVPQF